MYEHFLLFIFISGRLFEQRETIRELNMWNGVYGWNGDNVLMCKFVNSGWSLRKIQCYFFLYRIHFVDNLINISTYFFFSLLSAMLAYVPRKNKCVQHMNDARRNEMRIGWKKTWNMLWLWRFNGLTVWSIFYLFCMKCAERTTSTLYRTLKKFFSITYIQRRKTGEKETVRLSSTNHWLDLYWIKWCKIDL